MTTHFIIQWWLYLGCVLGQGENVQQKFWGLKREKSRGKKKGREHNNVVMMDGAVRQAQPQDQTNSAVSRSTAVCNGLPRLMKDWNLIKPHLSVIYNIAASQTDKRLAVPIGVVRTHNSLDNPEQKQIRHLIQTFRDAKLLCFWGEHTARPHCAVTWSPSSVSITSLIRIDLKCKRL